VPVLVEIPTAGTSRTAADVFDALNLQLVGGLLVRKSTFATRCFLIGDSSNLWVVVAVC
jgi:hypothetical protein